MADTLTSVLTQPGELGAFLDVVAEQRGDPAAAVCQVFVPWFSISDDLGDLVPNFDPQERVLVLAFNEGLDSPAISLPISDVGPQISIHDGCIEAFGLRKVCAGVWALAPSLNLPELMHAFVVFHGVPEPAPWERLILLVDASGKAASRG